jgi:nucleotide sugar dehydrogenase
MPTYSVNPAGDQFALPEEGDYEAEFERLKERVERARADGQEIVVVMGVGFVGAVMAAIVADTTDANGNPSKFVIGCQRPSTRSYWKIPMLNQGLSPVKAEDPEVDPMIRRCVVDKKTLIATYNSDCLTLIETTVAPGTTEFVAWPILQKAFAKRGLDSLPLLAHSYERVMPGKEYVSSIRDFWRVCSGCNAPARDRVVEFLNAVLNTDEFPLTVLDRPIESETAKIVENSYRATTLAFLNEWSHFAERNGVDLIKVIQAIKVRPTHSNMIFPGPGIGGYCLPKDGALGYWAYKHILGFDDGDEIFKMSTTAIDINDTRGLHVATLTRDALRNMGRYIAGADVLLCGASYRQDVGDTRYSGSEVVVRRLAEMGAEIRVHDPYVEHWYEFEAQDNYPSPGHSLSRFFRNQEGLKELRVTSELKQALAGAEAVIFAVPHEPYLALSPDEIVKTAGGPIAVIDCFGILNDDQIRRYFELGCEVKGLGRGHIQRIKKETSGGTEAMP